MKLEVDKTPDYVRDKWLSIFPAAPSTHFSPPFQQGEKYK